MIMWLDDQLPVFNVPKPSLKERLWKKKYLILASGLVSTGLGIVIAIFVARLKQVKNDTKTPSGLLPSDLVTSWVNAPGWNITNYIYGSEYCSYEDPDTLVVRYPEGSYQNAGGFKFYSQPTGFPTKKACFSYEIYFPSEFPWMKGGKLPGMYIGDWGANGGNHIDTGYSARFMWRANGTAEVYLYIPKGQLPEYYFQIITNYDYGESMWRSKFRLYAGEWNTMSMCITLNTAPEAHDGLLQATVNNVTMIYNKLIWTPDTTMRINGLMMNTFFGGNDPSWATPIDTYTKFRKFSSPERL
jgi:hypothetical protein